MVSKVSFMTTRGSHNPGACMALREPLVNPRARARPAGSTCQEPGAQTHSQAHVVAHTLSSGSRQWGELGPVPPGGEDGAGLRGQSHEVRHPYRQVRVHLNTFLLGLPVSWPEHRAIHPRL